MGRGNAYAVAVQTLLLVLVYLQIDRAYGVIHTVGGSSGWDVGIDYKSWAAGQTFKVGDVLFFPYLQSEHDVVVVSKAGYDSCSAANAIASYSEGNDNVTLTSAGSHYYLCSVVGHCADGMKLAVTIAAAAAAPVPVPASAPAPPHAVPVPSPASAASPPVSPAPSPTAPAPAPVPVTAPVPAPATVSPVPAPAPIPVPAPAPAAPSSATPAPSSASTPSTIPITGSPPAPSSPSSSPNAAGPLLASALAPSLALMAALLLTAL